MSIKEIKRPVLRPSRRLNDPNGLVIDYRFVSGPEKTKNRISVTKEDYETLLNRITQDKSLLEDIINTWRSYAAVLRENGDNAEPPVGTYHKKFAELCDQADPNRGAVLATVFGEQIEADVLYRYIIQHDPSWSTEISVASWED